MFKNWNSTIITGMAPAALSALARTVADFAITA